MIKRWTPDQVQNGTVSYGFEAFLDDLWVDVETSLYKEHPEELKDDGCRNAKLEKNLRDVFVFVYEICNFAARNHPDLKLILDRAKKDEKAVLNNTLRSNEENIILLRAIYSREVENRLEQGLTKRQAEKAASEKCKSIFINWLRLRN